jgi:xanthine dehydrogenase accessory factor
MREILRTLIETVAARRDVVVCSLVETRGSTPQKAGAWMLVFADGSQSGTLGGGCVEAEVKQRALAVLAAGGDAELVTFQLDDNYGWDDGLICGGRMLVLVEPLRAGDGGDYFAEFRERIERGDGCTEAVIIEADREGQAPAGGRALFSAQAELVARRRITELPRAIVEQLPSLSDRPRAMSRSGVAYLPVPPRCRLVIVGAGHVGQAVGSLAAQAGFEVWVIDDRERYANSERFPTAAQIIVGEIGRVLADLEVDSHTFSIIVTRGHSHDEEALFHLVSKPGRYLGMIGSKRKIRLIFDDLVAAGVAPELLERVHAPLGIDIGSQTVPEIAISIVGELIAVRNLGHSPGRSIGPRAVSAGRTAVAACAATPAAEATPQNSDVQSMTASQ